MLNITPAPIGTRSTYINGDTIIQAFANHSLSLNVNIFPVFNRQHLHQSAVYVKWDSLWLNAEGDFVPAAVKKITDSCISEDHSHSILGEPNGIVLYSFVLSVQSDRDLQADRSDFAKKVQSLLLLLIPFHHNRHPKVRDGTACGEKPKQQQTTDFWGRYGRGAYICSSK